jgi:hypothetical protein
MNEKTGQTLQIIASSYRHLRGLSEEQFVMGRESDFFGSVVGELVDVENEEILYWAFLGEPHQGWLLVLIEDEVRLAYFGDQEAELRFLGSLRGEYVERLSEEGAKVTVTLSFKDDRLPGGRVHFEAQPGSRTLSELQPLRDCLRQWGTQPVDA